MAASHNYQQVEWSTADSVSVSAAGNQTSDVITFSATAVAARITCKADNAGTPASGDVVNFYYLGSTGDPDADPDSAAEYDTVAHAKWLARLDTNSEDPAQVTVDLPVDKTCKIYAVSGASSNNITVSAEIKETLIS